MLFLTFISAKHRSNMHCTLHIVLLYHASKMRSSQIIGIESSIMNCWIETYFEQLIVNYTFHSLSKNEAYFSGTKPSSKYL